MTKAGIVIAVLIGFSSLAEANSISLRTGELFTTARAKLYTDGWRADPAAHSATGEYDGVDRLLVQAGYSEIDYCSLGKTFCVLQYKRGNSCLRLHIQGEEIRLMKVERWSDDCREKGPSEGQNILPADVRYIAQWLKECEDFEQCKGADAFLQRLKKRYAKNPAILKILGTYHNPAEIYPSPQK